MKSNPKFPKYPIYVISKGRANICYTANWLEKMNINFYLVIEPQEQEIYAKFHDPKKFKILPFSNLGLGSIPARNWVWEDSLANGDERHWILDDNIRYFQILNKNRKIKVITPTIFRLCEDFTDRYENVAMSGMNYDYFAPAPSKQPPFYLNTRIYSCILLQNKTKFFWRGKYNEDTDLSLRFLKAGYCTILFNMFLAGKVPTLTMKGGNTDSVYKEDDKRINFAVSLKEQHPEHVEVVWRYNRWHHEVDYSPFKMNRLIKKSICDTPKQNYKLEIKKFTEEEIEKYGF